MRRRERAEGVDSPAGMIVLALENTEPSHKTCSQSGVRGTCSQSEGNMQSERGVHAVRARGTCTVMRQDSHGLLLLSDGQLTLS